MVISWVELKKRKKEEKKKKVGLLLKTKCAVTCQKQRAVELKSRRTPAERRGLGAQCGG